MIPWPIAAVLATVAAFTALVATALLAAQHRDDEWRTGWIAGFGEARRSLRQNRPPRFPPGIPYAVIRDIGRERE